MDIKEFNPEIDFQILLDILRDDAEELKLEQKELDYLIHSIDSKDTPVHIKNNLSDFLHIFCTIWFIKGMKYGVQVHEAMLLRNDN